MKLSRLVVLAAVLGFSLSAFAAEPVKNEAPVTGDATATNTPVVQEVKEVVKKEVKAKKGKKAKKAEETNTPANPEVK